MADCNSVDEAPFDPMQSSLPITPNVLHEDDHDRRYSKDSGIDISSIRKERWSRRRPGGSKVPLDFGAESDEDSVSEFMDIGEEGFGEIHESGTMGNNFTTTTTNNGETHGLGKKISESSTCVESHGTTAISAIGSTAGIMHQMGCKYIESCGPGLIQCDCVGTDIITRETAQAPAKAYPEALYAQLQAIMKQIYSETGQVVVPKLNTSVACEIVETGKEEVVVEVDVRVRYKSSRALQHKGVCTKAREVFQTGEMCPIMEGMEARN